MKQHQITV